jgi:cation diffusion facilitator family transporter
VSVQLVALIANILLAVMKFTVGNLAGSRALIADGFNSAGDIVATFAAWIAFRFGAREPDANHPYGHGNAEALAGLLIGGMLLATGAFIAIDGVDAFLSGSIRDEPPDQVALLAALATMAVKALLWVASVRVGRRTNSPTLLASARDHRADVLIGAVAFAGIFLAGQGVPELDAMAGVAIGLYVFWLGIEPVRGNVGILMHEEPPGYGTEARAIAETIDGIHGVREVRVQPVGGSYRIDMTLAVDGTRTVRDAHDLAHLVEDRIRAALDHVTEVYVHVEPHEDGGAGLTRA